MKSRLLFKPDYYKKTKNHDAIAGEAFRNLGAIHHNIETERSAEFGTIIPQLEDYLEILTKIPKRKLIENERPNSINEIQNPTKIVIKDPKKSLRLLFEYKFRNYFLRELPLFGRAISNLPANCKYSPTVDIFIELYNKYQIKHCADGPISHSQDPSLIQINNNLNNFYSELIDRISHPTFQKQIRNHREKFKANTRRYHSYIDSLFRAYSRLVVIRLDLEYSTLHKATIDEAKSDITRFISNQRHNKLFHALRGYIIRLEFGITNGYHFHTLLLFDGSIRSNHSDQHLAQSIGEYWNKTITKGRGRYWNCNGQKDRYHPNGKLGIGTIYAIDLEKINNLKRVVEYLCKKDQFFSPTNNPKFKTLHKGKTPKITSKKIGRPRLSQVKNSIQKNDQPTPKKISQPNS